MRHPTRGPQCSLLHSVLAASPLHELLEQKAVLVILVESVSLKDRFEIILGGGVLLNWCALDLVTSGHLLGQLLEKLGIGLREVGLLLTALLILEFAKGANGGSQHGVLDKGASSLESEHFLVKSTNVLVL